MLYRAISLALAAILVNGSIFAQGRSQPPQQSAASMQQVLHKAQDKDKPVKVILKTKIDNQTKLNGKVSEISESNFVLASLKNGKTQRLAYEDVQQVKQAGMSKGAKIAIVATAGVVVVVVVMLALTSHSLDNWGSGGW